MEFPVLGLWKNEAGLRDHLAENIEKIELGLTLVKTEHAVPNARGAGGKVDILATDTLGNYVCIEVKRSDNSARATLNELSKYLVLLCQQNDLQKERVRCVLVSTHWHEVLLPLSTFAETCGADVSGYKALKKDGALTLERQELLAIEYSPQISPEVCVMYFVDEPTRQQYLRRVRERAARLPFVRIALLCLNPKPRSEIVDHVAVTYIWNIPPEFHPDLEQVIGRKIGWLEPYAHPTSKAETDAAYWIFEEGDDLSTFYSGSARIGTPEKITNLLGRLTFRSVEKVGRWPAGDVINTDEKLLSQMVSFSPMKGGAQQNNYTYKAKAKPHLEKGFAREVSDFLDFLSFSDVFKSAAQTYLKSLNATDVEIDFEANRGRNTFMDLYLSSRRGSSQLASFQIIMSSDGKPTEGLVGGYFWDGETFPHDVARNMEAAYGSTFAILLQAFSSGDWDEDQDTMAMHGLIPVVFRLSDDTQTLVSRGGKISSLILSFDDFARINKAYLKDLSHVIEGASNLGSQDISAGGRQVCKTGIAAIGKT